MSRICQNAAKSRELETSLGVTIFVRSDGPNIVVCRAARAELQGALPRMAQTGNNEYVATTNAAITNMPTYP